MGGSIPVTAIMVYLKDALGLTSMDDRLCGLRLILAMDDEFRICERELPDKNVGKPPAKPNKNKDQ